MPPGLCITASVYADYVTRTGVGDYIAYELGRKPLEEMRWEEMWDAALRIRNRFLRTDIPEDIRLSILQAVRSRLPDTPLAIRSSSNFEDSAINSYAGLHDSFLTISGTDETLRHIRLVWASLWSDAAIAYSRELRLDAGSGQMAVVIQSMVVGEVSGVAFAASPASKEHTVIEAVAGLNKGLVDGDVEPERWVLDRSNGEVSSCVTPAEYRRTIPAANGTAITHDPTQRGPLLTEDRVRRIYRSLRTAEQRFGFVPDMEWTYAEGDLYILQVRPVSDTAFRDTDARRGWDMTLRRSFHSLKGLSTRIENELIPALIAESERFETTDLGSLDDRRLGEEVCRRQAAYERWHRVYWDEFIPFAHGARLFGQIYNDRLYPHDPFEFMDLLIPEDLASLHRNRRLGELARTLLRKEPDTITEDELRKVTMLVPDLSANRADILPLLKRLAGAPSTKTATPDTRHNLTRKFIDSFPQDERHDARELLDLARRSYRLRDDDNLYLGRIEHELERARKLCEKRPACHCEPKKGAVAARDTRTGRRDGMRVRQARGQPAGKGIARGRARVIRERGDLLAIQQGEIIVCDSINPEMTFIIPLVSGIIERRGGMLIHGAIIAREYGIPCVTGIPDATDIIRTGDDITVDGYFGLVINHSAGDEREMKGG